MFKINRILDIFEDTIIIAGLFSTAFVLFINVLMRYILKSGLVWAEEFARYMIIWIVCGGMGAAVRAGAHMRITAILDMTKNEKFHFILNTVVIVIAFAFSAFLFVYGIKLCGSMITNHQVSPAMEIPLWWVYLSFPVGGFLMMVRYIQSLVQLWGKRNPTDGEVV